MASVFRLKVVSAPRLIARSHFCRRYAISSPMCLSSTSGKHRIATEADRKRIHIQGVGVRALLTAFALRSQSSAPSVTLCVHHNKDVENFQAVGGKIALTLLDGETRYADGIEMEVQSRIGQWEHPGIAPGARYLQLRRMHFSAGDSTSLHDSAGSPPGDKVGHLGEEDPSLPIFNLIMTPNSFGLEPWLQHFKPRLGPESTVMITAPRLEIPERIFKHVFPDPSSRPTLLRGLVT